VSRHTTHAAVCRNLFENKLYVQHAAQTRGNQNKVRGTDIRPSYITDEYPIGAPKGERNTSTPGVKAKSSTWRQDHIWQRTYSRHLQTLAPRGNHKKTKNTPKDQPNDGLPTGARETPRSNRPREGHTGTQKGTQTDALDQHVEGDKEKGRKNDDSKTERTEHTARMSPGHADRMAATRDQ